MSLNRINLLKALFLHSSSITILPKSYSNCIKRVQVIVYCVYLLFELNIKVVRDRLICLFVWLSLPGMICKEQ